MNKIKPTHGGARPGSGRKKKTDKPLTYTMRLSESERALIIGLRGKKPI